MVDPSRVKKLLESNKSKAKEVYNFPKPATRPAQNIDKGYVNPRPAQNVNPKSKNILDRFPKEKQKVKDQKLSQQSQREDKRRKALKTKTKPLDKDFFKKQLSKEQKEIKRREAANKKAKYSGKSVAIPKVGGQFNKPFGGVERGKRRVRRRGMFDI